MIGATPKREDILSDHATYHASVHPDAKAVALICLASLLLALGMSGCEERGRVVPADKADSSSGEQRLLLRETRKQTSDGVTSNFHSLVWQKRQQDGWADQRTITKAEFNSDVEFRRWVSDLHSFDPMDGTAIIKIAEGDAPRNAPSVSYNYRWCRWDLEENKKIAALQECSDPFEPFRGSQENGSSPE